MKKFATIISITFIVIIFIFFEACKHEREDACKAVSVVVNVTKTDASINKSDGTISATAKGGKDFQFSLNGSVFQISGSFTGLAAGVYKIVVKNETGCKGDTSITIGTIKDDCAGVVIKVTATKKDPTSGANGSITASATGGTGFTYSLNNGAYQASESFTGLAAGAYTVTAKNANGCKGTAQLTLVVPTTDICAGVTVAVTAAKTNPTTGANGSITASATGGTGFTYNLNNGTYQSSGSFTGLAAGTYIVTVKNANGCTGNTQVVLTAPTDACAGKTIIVTGVAIGVTACVSPANNGSITATASGSTGFTYNINSGVYQVSNVFSGLTAGNYNIGVKDANGCSATASVTVSVLPVGLLFADVKTIVLAKCAPCHTTNSSAGVNFSTDCGIVNKWSSIQSSTNNGSMPPSAPLSAAEKLKISKWVDAGHKITD